ncbi:hypothetical protein JTB14_027140 [Gonioctena quinquepunctata]|nr:hypothetical protein JTB14_027140 [Gonioctena quinquepunctata]
MNVGGTPEDKKANESSIAQLFDQLGQIETNLDAKISDVMTQSTTSMISNSNITVVSQPTTTSNPKNFVPVQKWGITFTGDKDKMSVMAFLEIVEEYIMSRGCTEADMMSSIIDLVKRSR